MNKKIGKIYLKKQFFNTAIEPRLVGNITQNKEYFHNHFWSYYFLHQKNKTLTIDSISIGADGISIDPNSFTINTQNTIKNAQYRYTMTAEGLFIRASFNQNKLQLEHIKQGQKQWQRSQLPLPNNAQLCDVTLDSFSAD